jgi:hypothetical protein
MEAFLETRMGLIHSLDYTPILGMTPAKSSSTHQDNDLFPKYKEAKER